jgi:PAS domain S-box-containing protein
MQKQINKHLSNVILEKTFTAFLIVNKEGVVNYVSPSIKNLKIKRNSILNHPFINLIINREKEKISKKLTSIFSSSSTNETITFHSRIGRKDHLLEARITNLLDDSEINGFFICLRDLSNHPKIKKLNDEINLRKKIETQLNENKERYELLINHANEAICVAQDGILKFVNPKLCEILKYDEKELLSQPFITFIHPDDRNLVLNRYNNRINGKKVPSEYTFRLIDSNEHIHWIEIHVARFLWDGRPATVNFLNEITDKIYTQKKYEKLFHIAPVLTLEIDADDYTILSVNSSFSKSVGIPAEELVGKKAQECLPVNLFEDRYQVAKEAIEKNTVIKYADERKGRYFFNTVIPLETPDGKRRLFVLAQDITDLRLVEKKYQRLIDSSPDAIAEVDGDTTKIITINPKMAANFNLTKEEMLDYEWKKLLPKDLYEKRFKIGLKTIQSNKIYTFEDQRDDHYFQNIFVPIKISDQKMNLQIISRDITDRKKMENELRKAKEHLEDRVKERTRHLEQTMEELKESEQRYKRLIQTAPVAIAICDLEGSILDMNNVAKQMKGCKIGGSIFSPYYKNMDDRKKLISKLNKEGSIRNWEFEYILDNNEHMYGLLNVEKIKYKGKDGYLTIQQDITPLKKAQEEIREVYDYLKNVINSTTEFIFTMDHNNKITMWNKSAETKIGYPSSMIIGKEFTSLRFIKNPQALIDYIKNISLGYKPDDTELIIKNKKGSNLIFRISVSIIKGVKNKSSGYVIVGQDITKAEQLREQIRPGTSYLQYKTSAEKHESLIIDLQSQARPFLLVTRGSTVSLHQKTKQMEIDTAFLDDSFNDTKHISSCEELYSTISEYITSNKQAVVLIDRLDFLIMRTSFENVLQMIYKITSFINNTQAVFIIQINPDMYTNKQLSLLKEELTVFQRAEVEDVSLDESLYQILCFIYKQNQGNIVVSYNKVGKQFAISKVTTGKRILELKRKGLVTIQLKGRMKSILITKKAEDLIQKRSHFESK